MENRQMLANAIEDIQDDNFKPNELNLFKLKISKKYSLTKIPSNTEILTLINCSHSHIKELLKLKPVRSLSGINVIAVMSKPIPCPHGRCSYCPSFEGVPQSYTGREPSSMRGLQNSFDPYLQVTNRVRQLERIGHKVCKIELIVQGGTFPATPLPYQRSFIKGCLDAINGHIAANLKEAQKLSETSPMRNTGITVETRPDYCKDENIDLMLSLGVTRVEIGVQNLYDDIYTLNHRGHNIRDVKESFRIAKDSGLKIVAHMMPGLPGSNIKKDLNAFKQLFSNPSYKPDMIKIYPCLVLKNSDIYTRWLRGDYHPYTTNQAVDLIIQVKKLVPPWIRIMRVQRDIPADLIVAGVRKSNLRQIVKQKLQDMNYRCRCIRCREAGLKEYSEGVEIHGDNVKMERIFYDASGGEDIFLSYVDPKYDAVIGYLRLRIPSEKGHRKEVKEGRAAMIRELHILGSMIPLGERNARGFQHKGYGRDLIQEAEEIAKTRYDSRKMLVLSGLGVKQYYRNLGYRDEGPYMGKVI